MTNQTYLEALEQSAEKVDECIEMLSGPHCINEKEFLHGALAHIGFARDFINDAIADEQLQRAVISREHMRDSKREDV